MAHIDFKDPLNQEYTPEALAEALAPLTELGFGTQTWTIEFIRSMKVRVKTFLGTLRPILHVGYERAILIGAMIEAGHFNLITDATYDQLYQGCRWLKTKEGREAVTKYHFREKLKKKAARRDIYYAMQEDNAEAMKLKRKAEEDQTEDYQLRSNRLRAKQEKEVKLEGSKLQEQLRSYKKGTDSSTSCPPQARPE